MLFREAGGDAVPAFCPDAEFRAAFKGVFGDGFHIGWNVHGPQGPAVGEGPGLNGFQARRANDLPTVGVIFIGAGLNALCAGGNFHPEGLIRFPMALGEHVHHPAGFVRHFVAVGIQGDFLSVRQGDGHALQGPAQQYPFRIARQEGRIRKAPGEDGLVIDTAGAPHGFTGGERVPDKLRHGAEAVPFADAPGGAAACVHVVIGVQGFRRLLLPAKPGCIQPFVGDMAVHGGQFRIQHKITVIQHPVGKAVFVRRGLAVVHGGVVVGMVVPGGIREIPFPVDFHRVPGVVAGVGFPVDHVNLQPCRPAQHGVQAGVAVADPGAPQNRIGRREGKGIVIGHVVQQPLIQVHGCLPFIPRHPAFPGGRVEEVGNLLHARTFQGKPGGNIHPFVLIVGVDRGDQMIPAGNFRVAADHGFRKSLIFFFPDQAPAVLPVHIVAVKPKLDGFHPGRQIPVLPGILQLEHPFAFPVDGRLPALHVHQEKGQDRQVQVFRGFRIAPVLRIVSAFRFIPVPCRFRCRGRNGHARDFRQAGEQADGQQDQHTCSKKRKEFFHRFSSSGVFFIQMRFNLQTV